MTDQTYKIDTSAAQADLKKLAGALELAASASKKLDTNLATSVGKADKALSAATRQMEKYAQVATLLQKINLSGGPAKTIGEFADSLGKLGRQRAAFDPARIQGLRDLARVLPTIKAPAGGGRSTVAFLTALGTVRAPTAATTARLNDFFKVLNRYQPTAATRQASGLRTFFETVASIRVPSASAIGRLEQMFRVLSTAKQIPGAQKIAADLDHIAAAAARAGAALNALPPRMRGLGPAMGVASRNNAGFNRNLRETDDHARRTTKGLVSFGGELGRLNGRFRMTYQAGTLVNAMFASLTVGTFVKSIYDTGIAFQKLEKSMLFVTGTFEGARQATAEYMKLSNQLGSNALANADAFGRFAISAGAAGMSVDQTMKVFKGAQLALTAVGATSQQTSLAFYGISQAMAKGKISSEEFNRQIGEQIPGNVSAGVKALSRLTGQQETAASFFDAMRKGAIQSKPFLTAWADELTKMYASLLPLAEKRPDFQLNRLVNAFAVFKKGIGDAGFIGALTFELKRFADMFTDADGNLTPKAKKLADSLGQGLGKAVHMLGDGLAWLVDHLDQVVLALKGVAAFAIGKTLLDMGGKAVVAAQGFQQLMMSVGGLEKKFAGMRAAQTAAAGGEVATAGASVIPLTGSTRNIIERRGRTINTTAGFAAGTGFQAPGVFGRRQFNDIPVRSTAPAAKAAGASFNYAGAAAKGAAGAFGVARMALNLLPGVFLAAAAAAAIFGEKLVEVQGKTVKVSDIALGAVEYMGQSIWQSIEDTKNAFMGLDEAGKPVKDLGDLILDLAAAFVYAGRVAFTFASSVGKVVGGVLSDIIVPVAGAFWSLERGDFAGALKQASKFASGEFLAKGAAEAFADMGKAMGSFGEIRDGILNNATARAAARAGAPDDAANSQQATEAMRRIEDEQRRRQQEDAKLEREALVKAMERRDRLAEFGAPTLAEVFANIEKATSAAAAATGEAAKTTAKAAATLAGGTEGGTHTYAGLNAAYAGSASGAFTHVPAQYRDVITRAAAASGVSPDLLAAIAKRESSFNPNARNRSSSAGGMFQFIDSTAAAYGLTGNKRFDPYESGVAAGRYAKSNLAFLRYHLGAGRVAEGDAYTAHFLGAGGAMKLLSADPNANAANLLPSAAGSNRSIFYKNGRSLTAGELIANLRATVTGGAGASSAPAAGGPPESGLTESEVERFSTRYLNLRKNVNSLVMPGSVTTAAESEYANFLIGVDKAAASFSDLQSDSKTKLVDIFDRDKIQAAADFYIRKIDEAQNPILKLTRESENAARVGELRLAGMTDEAEFQEYLNGLLEESSEYRSLDNAEARASYKAMMDRNRALKSQVALMDELSSIEVGRRQRRGSAFDGVYADLVNSEYTDGSFASKMARAAGDPNIAARANAIVADRQQAGTDSVRAQLRELAATAKMSDSARAWRDDYKTFLESASGIQRDTLGELERDTTAAQQAFAKNAADIKKTIENPPGFQRWADSLEPFAERMEDIKANFVESLSGGITDALMGDDVDWTAMFRDLNRQVLKVQVDEMLKGVINGGNSLFGKLFGGGQGDALAGLDTPEAKLSAAATSVDTSAMSLQTAGSMLQQAATQLQSAAMTAGGQTSAYGVPGNWGPADLSGLRAVNDNSIMGGILDSSGGAGFVSSADRMAGLNAAFNGGSPAAAGGGFMGRFGGGLKSMAAIAGLSWLGRKLSPKKKAENAYEVIGVPGVLGNYSGAVEGGEMTEGKPNKWGSILGGVANLALSSFMGGPGAGGKFLGLFSEGGYATHPVGKMPASFWTSAPAYAEGTPNTSSGVGIPAILHPNEAVIPLTRGRKVPIEGDFEGGGVTNTTVNKFTIVTPDPNAFRSSQNAIQRKLNRDQKRAQLRNLNA